jgi:UTP--glucose-1-phosphate uridylyltransferase
VYQIETAAGSALSLFPDARAVVITDDRFMPVKKCENLAVLWSDNFILTDSFELKKNPGRTGRQMIISLDEKFYGTFENLQKRFAKGMPSFIQCTSLTIQGDVAFGSNVSVKGDVKIINTSEEQVFIPDYTVIEKDLSFPV